MKERTIFTTILIPMLALIAAEAMVFALVLYASGLLTRIRESDRARFDRDVDLRGHILESVYRDAFTPEEMTQEELDSILPYEELSYGTDAAYVLCSTSGREAPPLLSLQDAALAVVARDSAHPELMPSDGAFSLRQEDDGSLLFVGAGDIYHVCAYELSVKRPEGAQATERLILAGLVKTEALGGFTFRMARMLALAVLVMILIGLLGSLLIGRHLSASVRKLSGEVLQAQREKQEMPKLSLTGIREIDQFAGAITAMSRDMMQQRVLEKKRIERERDYDVLTGLMNQSAFSRNCARIFATPDFLGSAAILMLDLDHVKAVNDNYGHEKGDEYIRLAATVFKESAPASSLIAKVAGDEFYILYYGFENREALDEQLDTLRRAVAEAYIEVPGRKKHYPLQVTGGIAHYPEDGSNHAELMKFAEFEAYQLKLSQKGKILDFNRKEYAKSTSEIRRRQALKEIIRNHEKVTYRFQPIFLASSGQVHAYESLMRAETDHLKYPMEILELARREKKLMEIERITWERGLDSYRVLLEQGLVEPDAVVLLNSISSLILPREELEQIAEKNADLMDRIVIEITESEHMNEEATAGKRRMPHFSGMFALDDYGSGYNSEKTLLELSPKYIKVDLSIIRDIDSSPDKQRIVSNIVRYAHERNMMIIAEGIETPSELQTVCDLGVDLLQGFYLASEGAVPPPLSREASDFLDRRQQEAGPV